MKDDIDRISLDDCDRILKRLLCQGIENRVYCPLAGRKCNTACLLFNIGSVMVENGEARLSAACDHFGKNLGVEYMQYEDGVK